VIWINLIFTTYYGEKYKKHVRYIAVTLVLFEWSQGSFSGASWENVGVAAAIVFAASLFVFMLATPIEAFQTGENYAQSAGVNIRTY